MRPLAVSHCVCAGFDPPGFVAPELRKFIIQFPVCRSASSRFHARSDFFNEALPGRFLFLLSGRISCSQAQEAQPVHFVDCHLEFAPVSALTLLYTQKKKGNVSHNSKLRSITVPVLFSFVLSELQIYPGSASHGRMTTA